MVWVMVIVVTFIALGAAAFVVWPVLKPGPAPVMVQDDRLTELIARKDAVMVAIKELEFDHAVGKLSDEDFALYDQRLRAQAVALMKQIDQVAPATSGLDTAMEAEIAQRRKVAEPQRTAAPGPVAKPAPASSGNLDADMEAQIAQRRKVRPAAAAAVAATAVANGSSAPAPAAATATAAGAATATAAAATATKPRFCTNCGEQLAPGNKFCANCGTPAGA